MPDILFWNRCNNRCIMCPRSAAFFKASCDKYAAEKFINDCEKYYAGDASVFSRNSRLSSYFLLTGGEPLMHPGIFDVLDYFRRSRPETELCVVTNGRLMAYPGFARGFFSRLGPRARLMVSLCGSCAAKHDAITQSPGSFAETFAGLKNIFALAPPSCAVEIRFVLHAANAGDFKSTLIALKSAFPDTGRYQLTCILYKNKGRAKLFNEKLDITLTRACGVVAACARELGGFENAMLYHFPLCLVPPELRARCLRSLPEYDIHFAPSCRKCGKRSECAGLLRWYFLSRGDGEIAGKSVS